MVSVLDSRSSSLGLSPGWGRTHFTPTAPLSTQGGWGGGGGPFNAGGNPGGGRNTPSRFMLLKQELSTGPISH